MMRVAIAATKKMMMKIDSYAKINLTLEVLGKRADGYHALRSLVAPISLADTIEIEETDDGKLTTDTGYGDDDLIVKAAKLLGVTGLSVRVTKRIPAGGGLGGGSADAAAMLLALNELRGLGKTPEELAELGAAIGSDVPALVLAQHYRETVLMEGRGEKVSRLSAQPSTPSAALVLVNPGVHSSTPAVFKAFTRSTYPNPKNDLEAPALALYPEIGTALEALKAAGAKETQMSGSGATVFGFADDDQTAARIAKELRARNYLAWAVRLLGTQDF